MSRNVTSLRFTRPRGEISRRGLFSLLLPRHKAVASVDTGICRAEEGCGLCLKSCPIGAINFESAVADIDSSRCSGCGACIASCPPDAITCDGLSREELVGMTDRLLKTVEQGKTLAVTCRDCAPRGREANNPPCPDSAIRLELPCLGMLSPWLMLRAFNSGASRLVILSEPEKCADGFDPADIKGNVLFVRELFMAWGINPERIKIVRGDAEPGDIPEMNNAVPVLMEPVSPDRNLALGTLVGALNERFPEAAKETISKGKIPFGGISLAGPQCSSCCICAGACPTGALAIEGPDAFRLVFRHELCVACDKCVEICPEKCIHLDRVLDLRKVGGRPETLFEDEPAFCAGCGAPIGPRSVVNRVRALLEDSGQEIKNWYELCPGCKIQNQPDRRQE